ncbi:MAG: GNAT family N-acetyltransferase [Chloroflexi bacterium]|nr:GNAT family N-acetyltransferase [Chloroflexota bacterium]
MHAQRIEEAALNAWPALQQMLYDGWILRFSKGYTKRANSVNPLFPSQIDIDEKISACERLYIEKGLPPIFRITPFAPPKLDQALAQHNFHRLDPTLVLHLDLTGRDFQPVHVESESLADWVDMFCVLSRVDEGEHMTHRAILEAIPSRRLLASLWKGDQLLACGVGVLEMDHFGLFDLVTDPDLRNRGHGTKLINGMLTWAQAFGASHAYLSVEAVKAPARHIYETKFGFQEVYQYWYRRK